VTVAWSGILSAIILFVIDKTVGLRVASDSESTGLDLSEHDEQGYII
jgi:Amt family ammonium transporter